jgi:hypothetical protein
METDQSNTHMFTLPLSAHFRWEMDTDPFRFVGESPYAEVSEQDPIVKSIVAYASECGFLDDVIEQFVKMTTSNGSSSHFVPVVLLPRHRLGRFLSSHPSSAARTRVRGLLGKLVDDFSPITTLPAASTLLLML